MRDTPLKSSRSAEPPVRAAVPDVVGRRAQDALLARLAPGEAPPPLLAAQERAWAASLQRAYGNQAAAVQLQRADIKKEPEPAPLELDKALAQIAPGERALNHIPGDTNTPLPQLSQEDQTVVDSIAKNLAEGKYVEDGADKMKRDLEQLSARATNAKGKNERASKPYRIAVYMGILRGLEARGLEADRVPLPSTKQRVTIGGDGRVGVALAKTLTDKERVEIEAGISLMNEGLKAGRSSIRFTIVPAQGAAQIVLAGLTREEAAADDQSVQGRTTPRAKEGELDVHVRLKTKKKPNKYVAATVVHELLHSLGVDHFEQTPLTGALRVFGNSAFRHGPGRVLFNPGAASSGLTGRDVEAVNRNYPQLVLGGPPSPAG